MRYIKLQGIVEPLHYRVEFIIVLSLPPAATREKALRERIVAVCGKFPRYVSRTRDSP